MYDVCRSCRILGVAMIGIAASMSLADPVDLTNVLPADTLIYIGHSGSEQTTQASQATAFGKLLADPQFERLADGVTAAIDDIVKQKLNSDEQAAVYAAAKRTFANLWKYPTALAVLDAGIVEQAPYVQGALICKAGSDVESLAADLAKLTEAVGLPAAVKKTVDGKPFRQIPVPLPGGLYYGTLNDYFVLAIGDGALDSLVNRMSEGAKASFAKSDKLVRARKAIGGPADGRIFTFYVDAAKTLACVNKVTEAIIGDNAIQRQSYEQFVSAAQMGRLHSICYESYYHKGGILSGLFIQQAPAEGKEAPHHPSPITEDDLAIIPKTASWAWAANVDLSHAAEAIAANFATSENPIRAAVVKWITDFEADIGFCLDTGLLQLIGDTVILYDAPDAGGIWFTGTTAIIKSSNAEQLQSNLRNLVKGIAKKVGKSHLNVKNVDHHGHTIAFANVTGFPMPLAPAWARHEDWIIVGLYPQSVMSAVDRLATPSLRESSILVKDDFITARKVLGPLGSQVSYVDTKAGMEALYPFMLMLAQTGAAMAQGQGAHVDISMFPSREVMTKHLFGDVSITRDDENGYLQLSYGPLPVNPVGTASIASTSLAISIMLPALSRARELSKRTVCAANLRGIGQAMYIHAQDGDRFPDDFQTLIKELNATPLQFHCPSTDSRVGDLTACYEYIRGQKVTDDPHNVLIYEKPDNHGGEGGNVLFVDGHVEFVKPPTRIKELVKQTKQRITKKEPPRKEPEAEEEPDE